MRNILMLICGILVLSACEKDEPKPIENLISPKLIMKFQFDSTQVRLNNLGQPSVIPAGHQAQSPVFNKMAAHYIELAQGDLTPLGQGKVIYHAAETTAGGANAIDFSSTVQVGQNEVFFSKPLTDIAPGTYKWLRLSIAYQNYDIRFKSGTYNGIGTIASFVGFNSYITNYTIKNVSIPVNANKLQGYWGFETTIPVIGNYTLTGQAPAGATTVVNPLQATSPIPAGSCVVTGSFVNSAGVAQNLTITGSETSDIVVVVKISTNKSFEWEENSGDTAYEPSAGDVVVDMGVRGMIPVID